MNALLHPFRCRSCWRPWASTAAVAARCPFCGSRRTKRISGDLLDVLTSTVRRHNKPAIRIARRLA